MELDEVTISPFDATYIYILDGVLPGQTGASANLLSNVAVGTHTITVNYGSDCTVDIPVVVEPGNAFEASITAFENLDCNADSSGTITITANNFGAGGFEYSLNGAAFVGPFTAVEQITGLDAIAYTITVRDVDDPIAGCTVVLNQTLDEPTPIVAAASITEQFTCNNTGATITASATGGTPTYEYQLEDDLGAIITAYQASVTFTNVAAGDYIIRARDLNACSDPIDTVITIVAPANPVFTTTPTACYSGANDGSILIDVTSLPGNGGFQFSINAGPWITPTPATATSHTFDNLANGTYTIDVRDAFGFTASGGDSNFAYAYVTTGTPVTAGDFSAANTFAVSTGNDGDYDVYVWDNNAVDPHCEFMETVTVSPATPITYTSTPTDPACHDGVGSIEVIITSGDSPYTIQIIDLDNGGASDQTNTNVVATTQSFFNLSPGNYTINVTDANSCTVIDTPITINNPDELIATITPILPAACGSIDPNDYGFQFTSYPTTYPVGTTIEFSADGGVTWISSDIHMGYISGTSVFPSMRNHDLDISISTVVVACNELQVTVQGTAGVPNYEYTYTDDPSTFDITTATWTVGVPGAHTWVGLVPGRSYVFYVRDSTGCVRQSNVNVNDITTNPLEITADYEPSCSGANDAEITYTITDTDGTSHPSMRWEFYNANTGALIQTNAGHPAAVPAASTITITGLAPAEYYIVVTEVDALNADACVSGSENLLVEELNPITATLNKLSDISCSAPGLIAVQNIQGGGGTFTFTVTGPAPFTTITATSDNPISIPANSPAGNYNVTITDQFNCFTDLGVINLLLTPNPTIDSMVVDNCASPTSLTINASSTAAQILYSIDGGTTNGCTDTDTIEIHPVLEASVSLTKLIDCTVSPDAEITINVTFGSGNYDYEITNGLGTVVTRAVLPSNPFIFNAAIAEDYIITKVHADVTCNGSTDGTITLTETPNGINPLTYAIAPALGTFNATTSTFENLPVGTYTVTGTGTNSCSFDITNIIIGEPAIIAIPAPTIVEFGCTTGNSQNNATITIDDAAITGGSNTYVRYEFINDQGTVATGDDVVVQDGSGTLYTETNIIGGTYIINAYDDNGCIGTTTATILPYVSITDPTVTITQDITCNPGDDAEITVGLTITPALGATDISYAVAGTDNAYNAPNQPSNAFTALGIGNYLVTVTNHLTGCVVQTTFEIEDPNTFEIATATTDVVCFGDDGTVSFTISDTINPYAGGFTWQIYESQGTAALGDDVIVVGATGVSANVGPTTPFGIGAGEYRVEITQDADPSCVNNAFFNIAGPTAAITANTEVTPITCVGNDGVIEIIDVLGGWGGYQYYVGTYQAWVLDQNGCQAEIQNTIVLADPTPIDAQLQLNQPNCPNFAGEIEVINVTGGQGSNYTYQLIKDGTATGAPQNTTVFSGLDAGSYTVQITDQWTCTFTTVAELLYAPIVPLATVVKTIDCTVDPGGQVTITQTGGSGNFDYLVTFPDGTTTATNTTGVFTTLTQVGDYVFTITDQAVGHACPVNITQNLQDSVLPVLNIDAFTDVTCNGADDGTITVSTLDNGVGPYTFEIISGDGSSIGSPILPTSNTTTTATFTNLTGAVTPGITYTIRATATNECTTDITQVILQPEAIANVNATVVEFGCAVGNNPDNATITIDDAAITWRNKHYWRNIYHQCLYNGCIGTTTATILPYVSITDPTVTITQDITCNPGDDAEITVGLTITPALGATDISYAVAGTDNAYNAPNQPSNAFTALGIGNYLVTVTNHLTGCVVQTTFEIEDPNTFEIATATTDVVQLAFLGPTTPFGIGAGEYRVEITQDADPSCVNNAFFNIAGPTAAITANTEVTPITCVGNDGVIEIIDVLGGWGGYQYYVGTVAPTVVGDYVATPRFDALAPGTYQAWVLDQNGCQAEIQNTIVLADPTPIDAQLQLNQPNCPNFAGEIEVINVTGGQGNAGSYTVQITDQWTCTFTTVAELLYAPIVPLATVVKTIDCTVDPGGQVTITQTGGSGNFDYLVTFPDGTTTATNTTGVFTTLTQVGDYVFTITDQAVGHACPVNITQNLQDSVLPVLNIDAFTDVTCNGADDGTITVSTLDNGLLPNVNATVVEFGCAVGNNPDNATITIDDAAITGGSNTYVRYEFINTTTSTTVQDGTNTSYTETNFDGGSYTINVYDDNGCIGTTTATIIPFVTIADATVTTLANVTCTPGLGIGNYAITITNLDTDCIVQTTYEVLDPDVIDVVATKLTDEECLNNGVDDGSFSVTISDYTGNYSYQVYDNNDNPVQRFAKTDDQGSILIDPEGGVGPYTIVLTNTTTSQTYTETNVSAFIFSGLSGGDFDITITDSMSCPITDTITLLTPDALVATIASTPIVCYNGNTGTHSTSPLTCLTGVELLLSATGGSGVYEYSDDNSTWIAMTGNTQNLPVSGVLPAGTYRYFVRDATNACASVQSNEISEDPIEALVLELDTTAAFINCNGDTTAAIYASATGGLGNYMYELYSDPSLSIPSRIAGPQSLGEFSNLAAGTYYVNVFSEDCTTPAQEVIITEPTLLDYTDDVINALCFGDENGSITVTLSGGSGGYQYSISPNLNQFDDENTFEGLAPGDYTVIAQDQNGCFIELQYTITAPEAFSGTAPYSTRLSSESDFVQDRVALTGLSAGAYILFVRDANGCEANTAITVRR
ncbi:hypothetical protein GQR58_027830 [Nymphon striatum]|nr:hypothetical protein GQR58_027830 [Nymphon striatum]